MTDTKQVTKLLPDHCDKCGSWNEYPACTDKTKTHIQNVTSGIIIIDFMKDKCKI